MVDVLDRADIHDAKNPIQTFNHEQYRGLIRRLEGFCNAENWRNGLLSRVESVRPIADMTIASLPVQSVRPIADMTIASLPVHKTPPFASEAAGRLAGTAAAWVGTRLCIDQAAGISADMVPPVARDSLSEWQGELEHLRATLPAEEFLVVLLNSFIRSYVDVWGVPTDHHASVFDRVTPVVRFIVEHPRSDEIIDKLLVRAPESIYREMTRTTAHEFNWLLPGA